MNATTTTAAPTRTRLQRFAELAQYRRELYPGRAIAERDYGFTDGYLWKGRIARNA